MHKERYLLFFVPTFTLLAAFTFFPILYMFALSLTNASLVTFNWKFVGLRNLIRFVEESVVPLILSNTAKYVLLCVVFQFLLGFLFALLLDNLRTKRVIRSIIGAILLMPWVFSDIIAVGAWKFMFNDTYGMVNYYITRLGLNAVNWFSDPNVVIFTVILLNIWKGYPFSMILEHAGMQTIPSEVKEAAKIDGANLFKSLIYVTIPIMRYVILSNLVLIIILTFNVFNLVYAATHGDPVHHSEIIGVYMYNEAFKTSRIGFSAAISVVMTVFSTIAATIYLILLRRRTDVT